MGFLGHIFQLPRPGQRILFISAGETEWRKASLRCHQRDALLVESHVPSRSGESTPHGVKASSSRLANSTAKAAILVMTGAFIRLKGCRLAILSGRRCLYVTVPH